jgi:hypothetical protein
MLMTLLVASHVAPVREGCTADRAHMFRLGLVCVLVSSKVVPGQQLPTGGARNLVAIAVRTPYVGLHVLFVHIGPVALWTLVALQLKFKGKDTGKC